MYKSQILKVPGIDRITMGSTIPGIEFCWGLVSIHRRHRAADSGSVAARTGMAVSTASTIRTFGAAAPSRGTVWFWSLHTSYAGDDHPPCRVV